MGRGATAEERAAWRRANLPGTVIKAGEPKPPLYDDATYLERLGHLSQLIRRQAQLAGLATQPPPRAQWPGEIFRIGKP